MTRPESSIQSQRTKKIRVIERQAGVRLPSTRDTYYPPIGERRADLWWDALVQSLSATAIALVLGRRFELGTILEVNLDKLASPLPPTLLVRVAQVAAKGNGAWVVSGHFLVPLQAEALEGLS